MAFLGIKSTFLLLIITLVFSTHGVVEAGFFSPILKSFSGRRVLLALTDVDPTFGKKAFPAYPTAEDLEEAAATHLLKTTGANLAKQFFGPNGAKGFRWGWKAARYYLKIAERCEKYQQYLKPYCIPQSYSLRPDCVVKCIVVTSMNTTVDDTPTSCYDSCDDPVEAKCDETLTYSQCSKLING